MRRTLSHQIRKEEYMILAKLCDWRLLCCEILCSKNLLSPPFITGSSTEHTAHQMIASICMAEGMKGIVLVHAEFFAGNKDSSWCSKRNVTLTITNRSGAHCRRCIIPCTCDYFHILRKSKFFCHLWLQGSYNFPALINLRKLLFCHAADFHHFPGPAAVLYIQKKHTRGIGNIRTEGAA